MYPYQIYYPYHSSYPYNNHQLHGTYQYPSYANQADAQYGHNSTSINVPNSISYVPIYSPSYSHQNYNNSIPESRYQPQNLSSVDIVSSNIDNNNNEPITHEIPITGNAHENVRRIAEELYHIFENNDTQEEYLEDTNIRQIPTLQQILDNTTLSIYKKEQSNNNQNNHICSICHLDVNDTVIRTLKCEHFFHSNCIDRWFCLSMCCPLCRENTFQANV